MITRFSELPEHIYQYIISWKRINPDRYVSIIGRSCRLSDLTYDEVCTLYKEATESDLKILRQDS